MGENEAASGNRNGEVQETIEGVPTT